MTSIYAYLKFLIPETRQHKCREGRVFRSPDEASHSARILCWSVYCWHSTCRQISSRVSCWTCSTSDFCPVDRWWLRCWRYVRSCRSTFLSPAQRNQCPLVVRKGWTTSDKFLYIYLIVTTSSEFNHHIGLEKIPIRAPKDPILLKQISFAKGRLNSRIIAEYTHHELFGSNE